MEHVLDSSRRRHSRNEEVNWHLYLTCTNVALVLVLCEQKGSRALAEIPTQGSIHRKYSINLRSLIYWYII